MTDPTVAEAIRAAARSRGFHRVGIAAAGPMETAGFYRDWLESGWHGGLDYLVRSADLRAHTDAVLPGARSAVVVGLSYAQPNPVRPGRPRIARYALGRDYHRVIRGRLAALARDLAAAHPGAGFRACTDSAPLLERELAWRAGLGWFGKNTMLIDSATGSWFLIGVLLTTLELAPDRPAEGGCGTCTACVDACPTGAIRPMGDRWAVDAGLCLSTWTIERPDDDPPAAVAAALAGASDWTFGCDVCQEVCPFNHPRPNQPDRGGPPADPDLRAEREWPPLAELAAIDESAWDRLTRGSAVRRAGWSGLRRQARRHLGSRRR